MKKGILNKLFKKIIRLYQRFISPLFPPTCRYYPSCSHYARQCFETYSFLKALKMSLKRLMRCHPFAEGGIDKPC